MKVWLIKGNCGDYYCEAEHVVAIASSYDQVPRLAKEAQQLTIPRPPHAPYKMFDCVEIPTEDEFVLLDRTIDR